MNLKIYNKNEVKEIKKTIIDIFDDALDYIICFECNVQIFRSKIPIKKCPFCEFNYVC